MNVRLYVMLCYVKWDLFTVGSLQFCNDTQYNCNDAK